MLFNLFQMFSPGQSGSLPNLENAIYWEAKGFLQILGDYVR